MRLKNLTVRNFRIIEKVFLEFPPGVQLLVGPNAQGKTSLLEAIYFLATATSHRTRKNRELIRRGEETGFIRAEVEKEGNRFEIGAGIEPSARRFKIDGIPLRKSSDLYGHLRAVFFSPEDLEIVSGGPNVRRRFLDLGLCQKDPAMIRTLLEYRRVLKQRNFLLKQASTKKQDRSVLSAWSPQLACLGAKVVFHRARYCLDLLGKASQYYAEIAGPGETFGGEYRSSGTKDHWKSPADVPEPEELEAGLAEQLEERLENDLIQKTTGIGPHRDDLHLTVGGISATRYASQGQRRTIALSMKLAEMDLLSHLEEPPVLLVDDVTQEMDETRRKKFLAKVATGGQAFLTFTEAFSLEGIAEETVLWEVQSGSFTKRIQTR